VSALGPGFPITSWWVAKIASSISLRPAATRHGWKLNVIDDAFRALHVEAPDAFVETFSGIPAAR
jgi:hypothetical protein